MAEVVMEIVRLLVAPRSLTSNWWVSPAVEGKMAALSVAVSVPDSMFTPSALIICVPRLRSTDGLEAELPASTKATTKARGGDDLCKINCAP